MAYHYGILLVLNGIFKSLKFGEAYLYLFLEQNKHLSEQQVPRAPHMLCADGACVRTIDR